MINRQNEVIACGECERPPYKNVSANCQWTIGGKETTQSNPRYSRNLYASDQICDLDATAVSIKNQIQSVDVDVRNRRTLADGSIRGT